jgi:hypothetical protein
LIKFGVDDKSAQQIQNNLDGTDLINLVNSLNLPNHKQAVTQANNILMRYGVNIREGSMNNDRLSRMYKDLNSNKIYKQQSVEHMTPIAESNSSEDHMLAMEGYNYYTTLEPELSEELMDWLDSNKVEFLTNGEGHFHIKCEDRDHAYKVGRTISGIMSRKHIVRDSHSAEGSDMAEKADFEKQANKTKAKLAKLKPRDPNALAARMMQAKSGGPIDPQKRLDQKDKFNRYAKHKKTIQDEEFELKSSENVLVNGFEGVVTIPKGPNGTVGIIMDGKLIMVSRDEIQRVDEGVLSVTGVNPLFRLRELAGLPPAPVQSPGSSMIGKPPIPLDVSDFSGSQPDEPIDSGMDDEFGSSLMGPDIDIDIDDTPGMDPVIDTDLDHADDDGVGKVEIAGQPSQPSPAMRMIDDHLNNVQLNLSEIKLSEYKTLIHKLQDLSNQLQSMGRGYLGERRAMKPIPKY